MRPPLLVSLGFSALWLGACAPSAAAPAQARPQTQARPQAPGTLPDVRVPLEVSRPEPRAPELRVIVMGDQGRGNSAQAAVARAMAQVCAAQGCDLGVGLGDNFYPRGPQSADDPVFKERFEALYGPLKVPFLMILGNHDQSGRSSGDGTSPAAAQAQLDYARRNRQWIMPARTYRAPVTVGGEALAEFFAVDTVPSAAYGLPAEGLNSPRERAQGEWLTGAVGRSPARWKIVLGHHPLYSNGPHGDAGRYEGVKVAPVSGAGVRALYQSVCSRAALLLSGHEHNLQVFRPSDGCPGTWTAVSGAAGGADSKHPGQRPTESAVYGAPGFMYLTLTPQNMTLEVYALASDGEAKRRSRTVIPAPESSARP